jgi:uncharacterized RDD family membrane protein YckC
MSQPWGDRPGEAYPPGPQQYPAVPPSAAVQPYSSQPYPAAAQPYPAADQAYPAAQPYPAQSYPAQPYPASQVRPVSVGGRFGAFLLDGLLILVTLGIGYLIWALITWGDGQTPAKKLLGHVVADAHTGEPFDWGRMALRQFVIQGLLGGLLTGISFGIYFWVDSLMILGEGQRTLHDRMANSVVRYV